ncbi:secreted RxLR effector protein 161-like [Zingiber officinale]|uniref:secreted RxLR effector protein 161-like n=1 Tax=Zingiber officinale TaxID=94328 RepID=UPI001C4A8FF7|nr:secreted RxLR effector protein 161-like [Zingiber officinale]
MVFVSQKGYAMKLVERFGQEKSKTRMTPLDFDTKLKREEGSLLLGSRPYRALVGSLLYLTITRPGISFSVGFISRFLSSPRKDHLEAAKKILKYINATQDMGLLFKKNAEFSFIGYTDVYFGGDLDDRRSTSGYVFFCGGTVVSWCNKKQASVSLSTTEAEYKAAALATQEGVWLHIFIEDLHLPIAKTIAIFEDNQSAIKLATNPVCHARTKHIELEHQFIREKVLDGTISTLEVRSQENIADIFTMRCM